MLVVPCISIGNCCAVCNASNLVAIVPPRHHTGILRCILLQPEIGITIIVHGHLLPVTGLSLLNNCRVRQMMRKLVGHVFEILRQRNCFSHDEKDHSNSQDTTPRRFHVAFPTRSIREFVDRALGSILLSFLLLGLRC